MVEQLMSRHDAVARLTSPGQPYELESGTVYNNPCRIFKNAPATLRELFEENISDKTFLVFQNERFSFEEIYRRSCKIARLLVDSYGIKPGDRVSISMRNYPEWIMVFTAVSSIGGIVVAMNALWSSREMEFGLKDSGSKVLIADQERIDQVIQFRGRLSLEIIGVRMATPAPPDIAGLDSLLDSIADCNMPDADIEPNDDVTIFYTSGSTGEPKGAVSCHRNIISALFSWELDSLVTNLMTGSKPTEAAYPNATLLAIPLFHSTGSLVVYLQSYRSQRKMVSMYKWDPRLALTLIEQERIFSFVAPAAMTGDLLQAAKTSAMDLSSLAFVGGGGASRPADQVQSIADVFSNAMPSTGWGMTETNAVGTGISGDDYLAHPDSAGTGTAVVDLRIVDESDTELPPGTPGELQIRGTVVIRGYWNRPDADAEAFVDGWLKTGDVAYIDHAGYVYIVDRIKDLVIRGGENIGCAEVEAALLKHPDIHEACVYAIPDQRLGEVVGTTLYSSEHLRKEELQSFLEKHLARFKIPIHYRFVSEPLPRIASGKINKRTLRKIAVKELL